MDFIKPMINIVILRRIFRGFVVLFSLHFFLFVPLFVRFLFFPSTFLLVLHAIFLSLILHSFTTYLFLLLCVFILYFLFLSLFPYFYFHFLLFFLVERVKLLFWQYSFRICVRTASHFFNFDSYTNGLIFFLNFTIATAVAQSLLSRGLFGIYRFPKLVLIRI